MAILGHGTLGRFQGNLTSKVARQPVARCLRPQQSSHSLKLVVVCRVAQAAPTTAPSESILCAKLTAHTSAISTALVLEDSSNRKQIVTAGLDKTLALWQSEDVCPEDGCSAGYFEAARLAVPGGPAFSMLMHEASLEDVPEGAAAKRQIYLGTHGKNVLAWAPAQPTLEGAIHLGDHCGWVRALTACGDRWLFSSACNQLSQWDMARAVPSPAGSLSLEKGDITALASSKNCLFAASADGALRSFDVDSRKGTLTAGNCRIKAHNDRITSLVLDGGLLFSASYDGSIKAWDPATLEIVASCTAAHEGERVHCLSLGPGRMLYSGGGDKLVRRWSRHVLTEEASPLHAHNHAVNALAFGGTETLVSGDKGGEIAVWKVC